MPTINPNELPRPIYGDAALAPPADPWAAPGPGPMPGPPQPPPPSKGGIPRAALIGIIGVLVVAVGVVAWLGLKGDDDGGGGGGGGTDVTTDTSGGGGGGSSTADQATDRLIEGFTFTSDEHACVSDQFAADPSVADEYLQGRGNEFQLAGFVVGCLSSDSLAESWAGLVAADDVQFQCVYDSLVIASDEEWESLLAASIIGDTATVNSLGSALYGFC